ncbi:MAG: hypothetical protein M1429_04040 [Patescibacteria group bacterium]|nr:hypothetical protein [Patescibacteria group bacterium]
MKDFGNPNNYNENQDGQSGPSRPIGPPPSVKWWDAVLVPGILLIIAGVGLIVWLIVKSPNQ